MSRIYLEDYEKHNKQLLEHVFVNKFFPHSTQIRPRSEYKHNWIVSVAEMTVVQGWYYNHGVSWDTS